MRISAPEIVENGSDLRVQAAVQYGDKQNLLWFSMDSRFRPYVTSEKLDGFLVGMLLLAMQRGEDIHLDSPVSAKLYYSLQNSYIRLLTLAIPSLTKITIVPSSLDYGISDSCQNEVVTGFSGGIDSFCVLADHMSESVPTSHRITRLLFNNVGSHGEHNAEKGRVLFHQRYHMLSSYPRELEMDFIQVDSNLSDLLQMNFQQTHVPRNAAPVLMLQKLFGRYLYASTYRYEDCYVGEAKDLAYMDPLGVHLLSTETLDCVSTGCEYSRVQKTQRVSQFAGARKYLNVCTSTEAEGRNCSKCLKCCRTLFTLELLDSLEYFQEVFDLETWKTVRGKYIVYVLGNQPNAFCRELREYIKAEDISFPLSQRLAATGFALANSVIGHLPANLKKTARRLGRIALP